MADHPTFVDTTVLAYARDRSETHKRPIAQAILEDLWQHRAGAVSTQVLQELYVVVTRKFDRPMPHAVARELVAIYGEWRVVQVDVPLSPFRVFRLFKISSGRGVACYEELRRDAVALVAD